MRTKFELWVVPTGTRKPLVKTLLRGDVEGALTEAAKQMRILGARVAEARNSTSPKGTPSLVLSSPGFPLQVILIGASLTDSQGEYLTGELASTGLSALADPISE